MFKMKRLKYLILFLLFVTIIQCQNANEKLEKYLNLKEELFLKEVRQIKGSNIKLLEKNYNTTLKGENVKLFTLNSDLMVFIDNEIYKLDTNDNFQLTNDKTEIPKGNLNFFISTFFNESSFLAAGLNAGNVLIYNNFNLTQTIENGKEAIFFTQNNNLYFIVLRQDNLVLYKWLNTYFDEIKTTKSRGSFKLSSFTSNDGSEIIIAIKKLSHEEVFSEVYEFRGDKLYKIHKIDILSPLSVKTYSYEGHHFVSVLTKSNCLKNYFWNGEYLEEFPLTHFEFNAEGFDVTYDTVSERPVLIVFAKNHFEALTPSNNNLIWLGSKNFTNSNINITSMVNYRFLNGNRLFFIAGTENSTFLLTEISTADLELFQSKEDFAQNQIQTCFQKLEDLILDTRSKILSFNSSSSPSFERASAAEIDSGSHRFIQSESQKSSVVEEFQKVLEDISEKVNNIQSAVENLTIPEDKITINGKVIVKNSLTADQLQTNHLNFKQLNNEKWVPEQWLLYSEPQTISGPVFIKNLTTNELETIEIPEFKNLLLRTGNQEVDFEKINNLTTTSLHVNKINGIDFNDIYLKNQPKLISGLKTFKNLHAHQASAQIINNQQSADMLASFTSSEIKFAPNLKIDNLEVSQIDNVDFETFKNSVYRVGITKKLTGNLKMKKFMTTDLNLKSVNNIDINNLLTTSTDQIIMSDIEFNRIFTENIHPNLINGIKLAESAALMNSTITGPVIMDSLETKYLEIIGEFDMSTLLTDGDHIIGTNDSDLLQIYKGNVIVKGDLHINNLDLHSECKLFLNNDPISQNIINNYWSINHNQEIPVHFTAENGIRTAHLITERINNVDMRQFMVNDNERKAFTNYHFENLTVLGNVILNDTTEHKPDLRKIDEEAVKINGTFKILGKKIFNDTLKIDHLVSKDLAGINPANLINKKSPINIDSLQFYKNLKIKGNLATNLLKTKVINDVDINNLKSNTVFKNGNSKTIEGLHFDQLSVHNLSAENINGHPINDYLMHKAKLKSRDFIKNIFLDGNVKINKAKNIKSINNIPTDLIFNTNGVEFNNAGLIKNSLAFRKHLKVNNLKVATINNINFPKLTNRVLYKNLRQKIKAQYTFTNLKAENIIVQQINNKSVSNLIDIRYEGPQLIKAPKGVKFAAPLKVANIVAENTSPCDLKEAYNQLRFPPSHTNWGTVKILSNVTFLDSEGIVNVFNKAVRKDEENIISAPVKLASFKADNVDGQFINRINLTAVLQDALLKESPEEQVVVGKKTFSRIHVHELLVRGNADIPVVNDISIPLLSRSIVRKNASDFTITGKKTLFAGLQTTKLKVKTISNVEPEDIVTLDNLHTIPKAKFHSISVDNLDVSKINHFDFKKILEERLLCHSKKTQIVNGTYFFEYVNVKDNLKTLQINDIKVSNIVFDEGNQIIDGPKQFIKKVDILDEADIEHYNAYDISKLYEQSILVNENTTINGSIKILKLSEINGNIHTKTINGYSVAHIKEILKQGTTTAEAAAIHGISKKIEENIKECLPYSESQPEEYMYVEDSKDLPIGFPNIIDVKSVENVNGHVLLHLTGEEDGSFCGLPKECPCPIQHTIQISPHQSINDFINKGSERVFSYSDENMMAHFITNSVSKNSHCRLQNVENEKSHLSWTTLTSSRSNGSLFIYPEFFSGYISNVEFFNSANGEFTYAIVGKYYDPSVDSHKLDCHILKFNKDKTAVTEIQRIPTEAAWTIYLLYTAQGPVLIIGSIIPFELAETRIYRFNEFEEKFELLNVLPSVGCTTATGVVLKTDSFLILANQYENREKQFRIYKYDPAYDNYKSYQDFQLNTPILGLSVFYTEDIGISDAHLCVVTENNSFVIYAFKNSNDLGWKRESSGVIKGLRNLIPFKLNNKSYLFAASTEASSLLVVMKNGQK